MGLFGKKKTEIGPNLQDSFFGISLDSSRSSSTESKEDRTEQAMNLVETIRTTPYPKPNIRQRIKTSPVDPDVEKMGRPKSKVKILNLTEAERVPRRINRISLSDIEDHLFGKSPNKAGEFQLLNSQVIHDVFQAALADTWEVARWESAFEVLMYLSPNEQSQMRRSIKLARKAGSLDGYYKILAQESPTMIKYRQELNNKDQKQNERNFLFAVESYNREPDYSRIRALLEKRVKAVYEDPRFHGKKIFVERKFMTPLSKSKKVATHQHDYCNNDGDIGDLKVSNPSKIPAEKKRLQTSLRRWFGNIIKTGGVDVYDGRFEENPEERHIVTITNATLEQGYLESGAQSVLMYVHPSAEPGHEVITYSPDEAMEDELLLRKQFKKLFASSRKFPRLTLSFSKR